MDRYRELYNKYAWRLSYRGFSLIILFLAFSAYGSGILFGYRPTFTHALGLDLAVFGWIWIAAGLFALSGAIAKLIDRFKFEDRWHFSVTIFVMSMWGFLLATNWTQPYGWTAGISWLAPCFLAVVIAFWPDENRRTK